MKKGGKKSPKAGGRKRRLRRKRIAHPKPPVPQSDRQFEAQSRAFEAIAEMRRRKNLSLLYAAQEAGTTPNTVQKYLPRALRKKDGRWVATESDRYIRHIRLPDLYGHITVRAKGWREAQLGSAYLAMLGKFASGKPYDFASFHGKKIGGFELITDTSTLRKLRDAGLLTLDSLYAAVKETA